MNIYDISEKAGVSIATVSRVLNGNANVSEKTRQKVLDVMEKYGYTPNVFARGLGLNTMKTIGLLCTDSSNIFQQKQSATLSSSCTNPVMTVSFAAAGTNWRTKRNV